MCIEIQSLETDDMWKKIDEEILNIIKGDLKKIGILKEEEIEKYKIIRLKNIYPITNKDEFNIQEMVDWINSFKNEFFINAVVDAGKVDQFMKKQIQNMISVQQECTKHFKMQNLFLKK